jgi:hypothetical protein
VRPCLLDLARVRGVDPVHVRPDGDGLRDEQRPSDQGLTLARFRAQLEDLRDTSLTLELKLNTFGTHPCVNVGHMGDEVSSS